MIDTKDIRQRLSNNTAIDAKEIQALCDEVEAKEHEKSISWELNDKEIIGHTFEGDGVYIIKKLHQHEYNYVVFWRDNETGISELQQSDHLLSIMNWCVKHWGLK